MIVWFTGQPGSGKTTLAKALIRKFDHPKCVHIDGDGLRELFENFDYSMDGRIKNIKNVINLARFLDNGGFTPIISVVAPYRNLRDELKSKCDVLEVYVHTTEIRGREEYFAEDYEVPIKDFLDMDTTNKDVGECINEIFDVYRKISTISQRT